MNRFKQESVYIRMLSVCDERSLEVVKATAKALIDTAPEKQPQGCFFLFIKNRADDL